MAVRIGNKAPNLKVSEWVQGKPTNIDKEINNVILVEVFQVNCPGCFIYGIPDAIEIYRKYNKRNVTVLGIATAFEDFDKNTLENLKLLLFTGEVIGETRNALSQYGLRGTPSSILIDKNGIVRQINFGAKGSLDDVIKDLL